MPYKKRLEKLARTFPLLLNIACLSYLVATADAQTDMSSNVCAILTGILDPLKIAGYTLVLLMILYAAVKYVYSADDPGGRKQAKSIVVNAIIGGILLRIAMALADIVIDTPSHRC